eukprot:evm.model.scf_1258.1 EVM.evm.TU.scf_1258.1   scf_1258:2220-8523(+)
MAVLGRCRSLQCWRGCPQAVRTALGGSAPRPWGDREDVRGPVRSCRRALSPMAVGASTLDASQTLGAGMPSTPQAGSPLPAQPKAPLAYEIVKGALVRGCTMTPNDNAPTFVLVHGILGSRRNMQKYAKILVEGYPAWQALLVDLRCHGQSAGSALPLPNSVESSARDILKLLSSLKLFPQVLVGHSFGGKVVMSMAQQFGKRLPRPVHVWVLDALPGDVRAGERNRRDHPSDLISTLNTLPMPIRSRSDLIDHLLRAGFSREVSTWMTTSLRPASATARRDLTWSFDLAGVEEMYKSYEDTNLWPLLVDVPEGLKLHFVRAEGSHYKWAGRDHELIESYGHTVHLLKNAGHWVHADNPCGLFDIMKDSIGTADLHVRRAQMPR